jgi:hypothetical protein
MRFKLTPVMGLKLKEGFKMITQERIKDYVKQLKVKIDDLRMHSYPDQESLDQLMDNALLGTIADMVNDAFCFDVMVHHSASDTYIPAKLITKGAIEGQVVDVLVYGNIKKATEWFYI